jgi:hypothetical protein
MPVGANAKINYQTLEANRPLESWSAPGLSRQFKIVAFISPDDDLGMTALLPDVAAAICALDKQAKALHIDGGFQAGDGLAAEDIELLAEMSDVADYVLVGLSSRPTPFTREILLNCDLVIVVSSCKIEFLSATENVVKALLYLGIDTEKVAGLLFDPEGILSGASLADIKPYLEDCLGLEMVGVVSYESGSGDRMVRDIEALVQYIFPHDSPKLEPTLTGAG